MSKEQWFRHYERRLAEAEENWPNSSAHFREEWASAMASLDTADEMGDLADTLDDRAKDRP